VAVGLVIPINTNLISVFAEIAFKLLNSIPVIPSSSENFKKHSSSPYLVSVPYKRIGVPV
jgi:hypothetical protein